MSKTYSRAFCIDGKCKLMEPGTEKNTEESIKLFNQAVRKSNSLNQDDLIDSLILYVESIKLGNKDAFTNFDILIDKATLQNGSKSFFNDERNKRLQKIDFLKFLKTVELNDKILHQLARRMYLNNQKKFHEVFIHDEQVFKKYFERLQEIDCVILDLVEDDLKRKRYEKE
jgi:hypothetical protein